MAYDIMKEVNAILNNAKTNTMVERTTTQNAATLGLGFHQFDGAPIQDVIHEIGADFEVRKDSLIRVTDEMLSAIRNGEPLTIPTDYIIGSHSATVHVGNDATIGVVGSDYGIIQNGTGFELIDLICNASVSGTQMSVVSAGMVHDYEPYIQVKMDGGARIDGDNSDTEFYCFMHTSHDGTSGMQIRFSPVRVVCRNTFMMNVRSKGLTFKHSKNVGKRIDFTEGENIKRVQQIVSDLNLFREDYIERMNSYRLAKVTDKDINEYITNLFISEEKMKEEVRQANYNFGATELGTRTKNIISAFQDTLESGIGQDTNRGTKLWLFNATTNYLSNVASYGNKTDNVMGVATKRFDSMLDGGANKKMALATSLLSA